MRLVARCRYGRQRTLCRLVSLIVALAVGRTVLAHWRLYWTHPKDELNTPATQQQFVNSLMASSNTAAVPLAAGIIQSQQQLIAAIVIQRSNSLAFHDGQRPNQIEYDNGNDERLNMQDRLRREENKRQYGDDKNEAEHGRVAGDIGLDGDDNRRKLSERHEGEQLEEKRVSEEEEYEGKDENADKDEAIYEAGEGVAGKDTDEHVVDETETKQGSRHKSLAQRGKLEDDKANENDELEEKHAKNKEHENEGYMEKEHKAEEGIEKQHEEEGGMKKEHEEGLNKEHEDEGGMEKEHEDDGDMEKRHEDEEDMNAEDEHEHADKTKRNKIISNASSTLGSVVTMPSTATESKSPSPENYDIDSTLTCDAECVLFRQSLQSWPTDKPKAAIYYLIHRTAVKSLARSISSVNRQFRQQFPYPIIVFIEPDLDNEVDRKTIHGMAGGESMPIYIQVVRFQIPAYVNATAVPKMAGFGRRKRTIGYRHMCRFHAGGVYQQPIMRSDGLEFGWRLDDDSLIMAPISYDVFKFMSEHHLQYGYRKINTGWSPVDDELWKAVDRYVNESGGALRTPFYNGWPKNSARYFNNFEISALSVWMSGPYRDFFRFVDRLGGIYYYKWGDAAIKTIAVTLFIPQEKTHDFKNIKYVHMRKKDK